MPRLTRTVTMPDGLKLDCRNSYPAELSARWIHAEVFEEKCYWEFIKDLPEGAVVLDLGANVGLFTVGLALQGKKNCMVHCVEPIPELAKYCEVNIARYPVKSYKVHTAGIGDVTGEGDIHYLVDFPSLSTFQEGGEGKEEFDAEAVYKFMRLLKTPRTRVETTLLSFCPKPVRGFFIKSFQKQYLKKKQTFRAPIKTVSQIVREEGIKKIDMIKIDTEGFELKALEGIDEEHWPMVQRVIMDLDEVDPAVDSILASHGFEIVHHRGEGNPYKNSVLLDARRRSN